MQLPTLYVFAFCVEVPRLLFQASVAVFMVWQMVRKNKTFSTTFYAIFTLQTIDDCAYYLATIIFFRLTPSGTLVLNFFNTGWGTVAISAVGYFVYVEFVAHAAIAINRYVAMVYPAWSYMNRTKYRWLAIGVVLLLPLPGVSIRFTSQMELVQTENGYAINDRNKWASEVGTTISMACCLLTCLVCVLFDLKTLAAYKRMSAAGRKERHADFCLLLYAMLQLTSHVLMAAYYVMHALSTATENNAMKAAAQRAVPIVVDLLSLSGSVCLFATSKLVRQAYMKFYRLPMPSTDVVVSTSSIASPSSSTSNWQRVIRQVRPSASL